MIRYARYLFAAALCAIALCCTGAALAGAEATPQEIVDKVKEASDFLTQAGDSGLAEFNDPRGRWAWKDSYVFVFECGHKPKMLAHINPKFVGMDMARLVDPTGRELGPFFCAAADKPGGGWVEYLWPKVSRGEQKPARKISFILKTPGGRFNVGAGVYNETISLDELGKMR